MVQDPTAPIVLKAVDVDDASKLAARQAALDAAQTADRTAGKAVVRPVGYRLPTDQERAECIALAKRLERAGQWAGKLDAVEYSFNRRVETPGKVEVVVDKVMGRDAVVTFGHWWVK